MRSHDKRKAVDRSHGRCWSAPPSPPASSTARSSGRFASSYPGYRFRESDAPRPARGASARTRRLRAVLRVDEDNADANVFDARGLQYVNLANGMMEIHTPDEHIAVADLEGMVEVTFALVEISAARRLRRSSRHEG